MWLSQAKYTSTSPQAKDLNLAYYIAKNAVPLSTIEKPGFQLMVSKLNPRYQLPSRRHFSDYEIPHLYSHVKDNMVIPALRQANFFSATTNLWTSGAKDAYMTVTIHFVNSNWELKAICLDTVPMFDDHTGQNIADAISDVLENWDLNRNDNLVATTTDSGSNVVAAFRILGALKISCFGHNLDLAIKKGLNDTRIQRAIGRCHFLVELFHRSWKKNSRLEAETRRARSTKA